MASLSTDVLSVAPPLGPSAKGAQQQQKKKAPGANSFVPVAPTLWAIHGQYYDLTPFVDSHPGGSEMLLLGRGRDCTEMFESVHALSQRNVSAMLARYRVDPASLPAGTPPPPPELFDWRPDGFYATLTARVRAHFAARAEPWGHKAPPAYWAKVTLMFVAWLACITVAYSTGALSAAVAAGFLMNMIGFCVMHDGSHYGISRRPWVNRVLHTMWSNWNLWSHFLWLRHHTYGHHSYTGVYRRDPDLVNAQFILRKHGETRFLATHGHQWWSAYPLLLFSPNQHIGQAILYVRAWLVNNVFGVSIERISLVDAAASLALYVPSLIFHFYLPVRLLGAAAALPLIAAYWTAQGIGYALNIIPNHDTHETHSLVGGPTSAPATVRRDWGAQQLCGSGNHTDATDASPVWHAIVVQLWGGMNYQIEHHLFPSVSHMHHAALAPIVRATAIEFGLPYTTHSWWHALVSYGRAMAALSARNPAAPKAEAAQQRLDKTIKVA